MGPMLGKTTMYGAVVLYGVYQAMRFIAVVYNLIAVGAVILIFVTYFPRGIWGVWERVSTE